MKLHGNARMTPYSRELMVRRVLEQGNPAKDTAEAAGVSVRTLYKWLRRYRQHGVEGLRDRSSRPHRCPRQTSARLVEKIEILRRRRMTAWEISESLKVPRSTVSLWLKRQAMSRLKDLEPVEPVRRYERKKEGELLHMDTKKLARIVKPGHRIHGNRAGQVRGAGWEYVHVCVDDHTRLAYAEVLEAENQHTTTAFLLRAVAWFNKRGIQVERMMTDNGPGYVSKRFNRACAALGLRHLYTRPYTPKTNGKAERFIQTMKRRWAYRRCYPTSAVRTKALRPWITDYNHRRPHAALGRKPPMERLRQSREQRA